MVKKAEKSAIFGKKRQSPTGSCEAPGTRVVAKRRFTYVFSEVFDLKPTSAKASENLAHLSTFLLGQNG